MRLIAVVAVIVAVVLIACSSELAAPQTLPVSTTVPTANPTATTVLTEAPVEQATTEATPALEPTAAPTATAPAVPTPEPTTASTDATQPPTATPVPTPTAIHTSELNILTVTITEVRTNLPEYDRDDWKHWTDADRDCQDARNEVLIAESRTTLSYRTDRRCRVSSGEWLTPYTNTVVTDPSKLDVDHMVPLSNAHVSGAWKWSVDDREIYANYLRDPQHLIAVTASANRSKGARGPESWKPEDRSHWCQYAIDWITIKETWHLTATKAEHEALVQMLNTCAYRPILEVDHCSQACPDLSINDGPTSNTPTPRARSYSSCDAVQAAGETRVQGSKGGGRGFPKWMVPSARDGDGDDVVCER